MFALFSLGSSRFPVILSPYSIEIIVVAMVFIHPDVTRKMWLLKLEFIKFIN